MVDNQQIQLCLVELKFIGEDDVVDAEESLFDRGVIDSLGIMTLTSLLTSTFGIIVSDEDLLPDNFDTISAIARYVNRKLGSANRDQV